MLKLKNTTSSTAVPAFSPPLSVLLFFSFLILALIFAIGKSPTVNAQTGTPTNAVESVVNDILGILRKPDFDLVKDGPTISAKVKSGFDSLAMAQSVLSTNWKTATKEQQTEFEELMLKTIEHNYLGRLTAYSNETVEFKGEEVTDNRATVKSVVISSKAQAPIPVNYKLRKRSDGWFLYDVEVENVSMVSTYRETYRSIVARDGLDGLLEQMRTQLNSPAPTGAPAA
ncbi:MAG: ABC transporter substrate-binding protein [Pseudomonadota bacterium]